MKKQQIIIGALLWAVFAVPVFEGVLNFGNAAGMLLSGALFFYGVFADRIRAKLKRLREKKPWRVVTNTVCVLFCCLMAYIVCGTGLVVYGMANTPGQDVTTAVVLGCKVRDDCTPSATLRMRLDKTIEFLTENPDAVCIVTGGLGDDEPITEAECMKTYLMQKGIDESRIYTEDKATSTKENLLFSAQIIKEEIGADVTEIALVTSDYHCFRAGITAKEAGLKAYSLPASSPREMLPTYVLREVFGIVGEWLFR